MLSGMPEIDISDWERNTEYSKKVKMQRFSCAKLF
jgi:hypothetical protein